MKNNGAKYRRKFYSLYLDTIVVLVFFLMLVVVVWLSMRPTPVLEAKTMAENAAKSTKEERIAQQHKFRVGYIPAPELDSSNNPELIAFGLNSDIGTRNDILYFFEYEPGDAQAAPRVELNNDNALERLLVTDFAPIDTIENIEKPQLSVGSLLNNASLSNETSNASVGSQEGTHIYWALPNNIPASVMPKIEPLMRKYGWLSGSLEVVLTVGVDGFVSNVVIYSEDVIDSTLRRELEGKLLALHLGRQNSNRAMNVGVSWNLP